MDDEQLQRMLPSRRVVDVGEARVGMVHEPGGLAGFEGCDALIYGHTHRPEIRREGKTWILNPGSPTERRRAPAHSMLLLEIEGKGISPHFLALT
jgi:predicted phosphodiesterase